MPFVTSSPRCVFVRIGISWHPHTWNRTEEEKRRFLLPLSLEHADLLTLPCFCWLQGMLTPPAVDGQSDVVGRLRHPEHFPPASAEIQTTSPGDQCRELTDWLEAGSISLTATAESSAHSTPPPPNYHHSVHLFRSGRSRLFDPQVESLKLKGTSMRFGCKNCWPGPLFFWNWFWLVPPWWKLIG